MRHKNRGRKLGRNPKHQRALLRNLATALILTERDAELDDNEPKVKGRIVTTIQKAKEVRPLVERCITMARRVLPQLEAAQALTPQADRHSQQWKAWRESDAWVQWSQAVAPVVAVRRQLMRLLRNKAAVRLLLSDLAPRFADRNGGYTRILRLAKPRLGDAGTRAILEFVGKHDRVLTRKGPKPTFDTESQPAAESPEKEAAPVVEQS